MESSALLQLLFDTVLVCTPDGSVIEQQGVKIDVNNVFTSDLLRPLVPLAQGSLDGFAAETAVVLGDLGRKRVRALPCESGFILCFESMSLPFSRASRGAMSVAEYDFIIGNMRQGFWRVDAKGIVVTVNDYLANWLETTADQIVGSNASDWLIQTDGNPGDARFEAEFLTPSGLRRRALVDRSALTSPQGRSRGTVDIITDITAEHALRTRLVEEVQRMSRLARIDPLTQAANRFVFQETLEFHEQTDMPFAVALLDADNLKELNDSKGHSAGDLGLIRLAERLRSAVRDSDIVARLGGDEFGILLLGTSREEVERVVKRIQERADQGDLRASLGWAHREDGHENIVEAADRAMYEVKRRRKAELSPEA